MSWTLKRHTRAQSGNPTWPELWSVGQPTERVPMDSVWPYPSTNGTPIMAKKNILVSSRSGAAPEHEISTRSSPRSSFRGLKTSRSERAYKSSGAYPLRSLSVWMPEPSRRQLLSVLPWPSRQQRSCPKFGQIERERLLAMSDARAVDHHLS